MGISFLAALPGFVWRYFSSSAVFHVVNASPSYADPVRGRPSSSAVLSREVNMLTIATAALLVLAATAEAAAIQYNPESRDTHVSDGPSFEHKRGFYYTDLHGKKIKDVSSWAPSWSSYRDAHPAEPSHSREPSMMSKPAYKDYNAPQAAIKDNGQYGTVKKKHTSPKTAQTTKPTTSTRREPAVRYARSSPTFAQSYRLRRKRSSGDGDETLKRLADALALVTHSLLSGEHLHHPMSAEKPAQEQEEPEAVVEDEPEEHPDDKEVDPKDDEMDSDDGEVDSDDDEVDPKKDEVDTDEKHHDEDDEEEEEFKDELDPKEDEDSDAHDEEDSDDEVDTKDDDEVDTKDDDEEDTEDPEEEANKPEKKSRRSKKKPKKPKKSKKPKKKTKKPKKKTKKPKRKSKKRKKKPEDSDMDHEDSDVDHEDSDMDHEDSDMDHEDSDMDYYGHDGYPSRK